VEKIFKTWSTQKEIINQVWRHMSVNPARLRQEDNKFNSSWVYAARTCLYKKKKKQEQVGGGRHQRLMLVNSSYLGG
jgi:hypothetical protein